MALREHNSQGKEPAVPAIDAIVWVCPNRTGTMAMSDLLVIEFPTEAQAEEVRQKLLAMQTEYLIELGDAVVVTKCPEGHVKLNQLFQPVKTGAVSGLFWGT